MTDVKGLTEQDLAFLAFEERWATHSAQKVQAIREAFGLTAARYNQILNGILNKPAALIHDPLLINRLVRARDERTKQRASRAYKGRDTRP